MSLFSSDIIDKDIDYLPDPHENMCFQITRQFNKLCDLYDPCCPINFLTWMKNMMRVFMDELAQNTWRVEKVLPDWWRGDFLCIISSNIITIKLTDGRVGLRVMWIYEFTMEWKSIDLWVDVSGLIQKCENWVV